jgi:hypothetical protein
MPVVFQMEMGVSPIVLNVKVLADAINALVKILYFVKVQAMKYLAPENLLL